VSQIRSQMTRFANAYPFANARIIRQCVSRLMNHGAMAIREWKTHSRMQKIISDARPILDGLAADPPEGVSDPHGDWGRHKIERPGGHHVPTDPCLFRPCSAEAPGG
jgi:hypothetical protein